jgi:hypothetical protein
MDEDEKPEIDVSAPKPESQIFGVSVRGWITLIIVLTVCSISGMIAYRSPDNKDIPIALAGAFGTAIGFYYGQKTK